MAFGAYQALQERGQQIPDDISIVSFDDDEIAGYLRPQLTTARIPYEEMGREAMAMLLDPTSDRSRRRRVAMPVHHENRSDRLGWVHTDRMVTRVLGALAGAYLLLALITRLIESAGVIRCHCTDSCWCRRPALAPFRWVLPWRHR